MGKEGKSFSGVKLLVSNLAGYLCLTGLRYVLTAILDNLYLEKYAPQGCFENYLYIEELQM